CASAGRRTCEGRPFRSIPDRRASMPPRGRARNVSNVEHQAETGSRRPLPLAGIKVLDLSRVLAGPWATMTLADLGAEVWKIENVNGGDDTRAWSVPSYKGVSTYFFAANRGKQSIAVDIKSVEGLRIVQELAARADIVVENFRTGV